MNAHCRDSVFSVKFLIKQLLSSVSASADNSYRDHDYIGYHKNLAINNDNDDNANNVTHFYINIKMRFLLHLKYNISLKKTNVLRVIRYKLQWRKEQLEIEYNTIIKWAIAFVSLKITNALII